MIIRKKNGKLYTPSGAWLYCRIVLSDKLFFSPAFFEANGGGGGDDDDDDDDDDDNNRPDIIRKKKGKACRLTYVTIPADGNVIQKAAENKLQYNILCTEIQQMYDNTGNDWNHRNSNKMFTETFGSRTGKTFNRFGKKDSRTWNITHNTESTAVWNLKPEWWGSPLVQKCRREKACDRRQLIIIIIIYRLGTGRRIDLGNPQPVVRGDRLGQLSWTYPYL